MPSPALIDQLARLRAAIVGTVNAAQDAQEDGAKSPIGREPLPPLQAALGACQRPQDVPAPRVTVATAGPAPLAQVADLDALPKGPRRLLQTLHDLGVHLHRVRGHAHVPAQIVLHQSQELLAAALGVHRITVWKWTGILKDRGYLDARAHKGSVTHRAATVTRNDGTLYAVRLQAGHTPRLRYDDLRHQYRDLDADRQAGNTAYAARQQSSCLTGAEWQQALKTWAVTPGRTQPPVVNPDCCPDDAAGLNTVQDVVYTLPLLAEAHPTKRAALVGMLGAALAHALQDEHSRRWYCRLIWNAWTTEIEGRAGLQALAAQLSRLDVDRREWAGLRNPGALLAARLTSGMGLQTGPV